MADRPTTEEIRAARIDNPKMRDRDLADQIGISEAELVAAHEGLGVTRIAALPERLIPAVTRLGEVMALTRNESCVSEKTGVYDNWHAGDHAAMVLNDAIDLRIFPSHWVHAFAIEKETPRGISRSLQIFDAAGDSVHKIFQRDEAMTPAWQAAVAEMALAAGAAALAVEPRKPTEPAKSDPARLEILRKEWAAMTDTHQFLRLTSKLKMNRLGANRIVGAPWARALAVSAVDAMLEAVSAAGIEVMVFVGNRGCIQIHSGRLDKLMPMGPWRNVMDPGFNLHLRGDHVAEVWAVTKPTRRGEAVSVEAFDAEGGLIFQVFGVGKEGRDSRPAWGRIVADLPEAELVEAGA